MNVFSILSLAIFILHLTIASAEEGELGFTLFHCYQYQSSFVNTLYSSVNFFSYKINWFSSRIPLSRKSTKFYCLSLRKIKSPTLCRGQYKPHHPILSGAEAWVRFPAGRPGLDSRRGKGFQSLRWDCVCILYLCSVLCCLWRWPWHSYYHRFRKPCPCLSIVRVHSLCSPTVILPTGNWVVSLRIESHILEGVITRRRKH